MQALENKDIQDFIQKYKNADIKATALSLQKLNKTWDKSFILNQINGYQRSQNKLPTWNSNPDIIFPEGISIEQCSSETTAEYKSSLMNGNAALDLTCGFGVDAYYLSKTHNSIIAIEQNTALAKAVQHNMVSMKAKNVEIINANATEWLENSDLTFDTIYIDPARRDGLNRKMHGLADCEPNILENMTLILRKCKNLLIKTSPMLDISHTLAELTNVKEVHVVAINNEVKEVLYLVSSEQLTVNSNLLAVKSETIKVKCINFVKEIETFEFDYFHEKLIENTYSLPLKYMYEPNAAILKAGAFKSIGDYFGISKLNINSHLYTSDKLINNFSGRIFEVNATIKADKKSIQTLLPLRQANILCRNYPDKPEMLHKKWDIKSGGEAYLIGTMDMNQKPIVLYCKRLK